MIGAFKRCLDAEYVHTTCGGDYAIQVDGGALYVLFEWSDGKEDWLNNLDFPVKPYKNMETTWMCHGGFLRVWKAMQDEVLSVVSATLAEHEEVEFIGCIGYSHGAALAVLATESLTYTFGDHYYIYGYGFGAPRVLWGKVPNEVKQRLRRFTTVRVVPDIVTHVPPKCLGFKHAGIMFELGRGSKYGPVKAHFPEVYEHELTKLFGG